MPKIYYSITIVVIVLFFSCTKTSKHDLQNQITQDAIKKYLDIAKNDTVPFEKRDLYNSKALGLIDLKQNDTVSRYYLSEICINYINTSNFKQFDKTIKIQKQKADEANDTLSLARYYRYMGFYCNVRHFDSSYYYYLKSERYFRKTNDVNGLFRVIYNQANLQMLVNDYLGADLTLEKAKKLLDKDVLNSNKMIFLAVLAHNKIELGEFDSAFKIYDNLQELIKNESGFKNRDLVFVYYQIGDAYDRIKEYKKAIEYYNKALEYYNKSNLNLIVRYIEITNGIAKSKISNNDFQGVSSLLYRGLNLAKKHKSTEEIYYNQFFLSQFYQLKGNNNNAKLFAKDALKTARKTKVAYIILNALVQLGKVDKDKASACIEEYDFKIDSLLTAERKTKNQFLKIQLETNEITQEKENAIKQKWVISLTIASILVIVILLFIIHFQRTKQKELKLLQSQQIANEETYQIMLKQQDKEDQIRLEEKKRIALELHDNIMNKLASTRHNLFTLTRVSEEETAKKAAFYIENIHSIENEIRSLSHDLSKDVFSDTNSFIKLVKNLIDLNSISYGIKSELEVEPEIDWNLVLGSTKIHLYRIIQEAMHNSNKYAKATKITISIIQDQKNLCMAIEDNGSGFNTKEKSEGIGIKNMKERIEVLGGRFSIYSDFIQGTKIFMAIPAFK